MNGKGAIYALSVGALIGGLRLILEILFNMYSVNLSGIMWFVEMNFLHFAVFLFLISTMILFIVSHLTNLEENQNLSGLTFATADKLQSDLAARMQKEDRSWHYRNILFSVILIIMVLGIWGLFF